MATHCPETQRSLPLWQHTPLLTGPHLNNPGPHTSPSPSIIIAVTLSEKSPKSPNMKANDKKITANKTMKGKNPPSSNLIFNLIFPYIVIVSPLLIEYLL
jgi:hypothetical protein